MNYKSTKQLGYFHIYTGSGKGKTTAALGLALRALGHGMQIYIGQCMKKGSTGEYKALERFRKNVKVEQFGSGRFLVSGKGVPEDEIRRAARGLKKIQRALLSGQFDVVICDEINVAVATGLISEPDVLDLIRNRPAGVELIFTGRNAPKSFLRHADLVSEIKEVKHYWKQGVAARKGIEQ